MDQQYKLRKEEFVANLSGGSIAEITLVTLVAPAAVLLWSALQSRQNFFTASGPLPLLADFLLNVGAILFATTAYSSAPGLLNLLLISPAVLISFLPQATSPQESSGRSSGRPVEDVSKSPPSTPDALPVRAFLTHYRGALMIITCVAIIAVDFHVFPRRFAKVENWGTSLMDLGVGSFVFSAGVVSARSLLKSRSEATSKSAAPLYNRTLLSIRSSIPLFILGLVRLYSVKGLDYAEHVTEYGVHWNFFFTLALLPPFVELSDLLTSSIIPSHLVLSVLSVLLSSAYETVLDNTDLKGYILVSPRGPDLLSKNREGVFSFIGYLSIFLAGRGTGLTVIAGGGPPPRGVKTAAKEELAWKERRHLLRSLVIQSAFWTLLFISCNAYYGLGLRVSRRLANLPYVLWINAFNDAQLLLFCLIETAYFPEAYKTQDPEIIAQSTSKIMRAFNKNGLVVFLIANLMTGMINLGVRTLDVSSIGAMGILMGYAAGVTGVALLLYRTNIKIKL